MDETNNVGYKGIHKHHLLHVPYCSDPPRRLTYDCGGFDGVHHLLQGLNVRVLVSELLLLVVKVASSLHL